LKRGRWRRSTTTWPHLAPNTTSISQPVDVGIGGVIKGKIKNYFEEWVIDNWENDDFVKYNEK